MKLEGEADRVHQAGPRGESGRRWLCLGESMQACPWTFLAAPGDLWPASHAAGVRRQRPWQGSFRVPTCAPARQGGGGGLVIQACAGSHPSPGPY